jgi:hypothetical protein
LFILPVNSMVMSFCGKPVLRIFRSARWLVVLLFLMSYGCETEHASQEGGSQAQGNSTITRDEAPSKPGQTATVGHLNADSTHRNKTVNSAVRYDR